jgi:microcin C transport system substrate-binding protein
MRIWLFIFVLLFTTPALAQAPVHALTMHGTPKYGPDFTHFDYTNPNAPKGGALKLHAIGSFDSLNPFIVKGTPAGGMTILGQNFLYDSLM